MFSKSLHFFFGKDRNIITSILISNMDDIMDDTSWWIQKLHFIRTITSGTSNHKKEFLNNNIFGTKVLSFQLKSDENTDHKSHVIVRFRWTEYQQCKHEWKGTHVKLYTEKISVYDNRGLYFEHEPRAKEKRRENRDAIRQRGRQTHANENEREWRAQRKPI